MAASGAAEAGADLPEVPLDLERLPRQPPRHHGRDRSKTDLDNHQRAVANGDPARARHRVLGAHHLVHIQGWRPTSVVTQPAISATKESGPAATTAR
jgi:hypothetical protein